MMPFLPTIPSRPTLAKTILDIDMSGDVAGNLTDYTITVNGQDGLLRAFTNRADELAILPPLRGFDHSSANSINETADVVGESVTFLPYNPVCRCTLTFGRATLWTRAGATLDLGSLLGYARSFASAINTRGIVVGTSIPYPTRG
jgi:uncharacterized membrane protein